MPAPNNTTNTHPDPKDNDELQELDNIMEDLIVGHNFEYARKALLGWHSTHVMRALERVNGRLDAVQKASMPDSPYRKGFDEARSVIDTEIAHLNSQRKDDNQ